MRVGHPCLTEPIIDQFAEYLAEKPVFLDNATDVEFLTIEQEYAFFHTGLPLEMIPIEVGILNHYLYFLQTFHDIPRNIIQFSDKAVTMAVYATAYFHTFLHKHLQQSSITLKCTFNIFGDKLGSNISRSQKCYLKKKELLILTAFAYLLPKTIFYLF